MDRNFCDVQLVFVFVRSISDRHAVESLQFFREESFLNLTLGARDKVMRAS